MGQRDLERSDFDAYRAEKTEQGNRYQDFASDILYQRGLLVGCYSSRFYQHNKGENRCGIEIKFDGEWPKTGNLYIEVAEKAHPDRSEYVPSGVFRKDNAWLFAIGNYERLWLFPVGYLRKLVRRYRRTEKPTSVGHLMPLAEADGYAIWTWRRNT